MANTDDKRHQDNLDPATRSSIGSMGGNASSSKQDMSELGKKGGSAAQQSGNAHQLTHEEQSQGGSNSGGNFANDPQRASEAGQKGGSK